MADTNFVDGVTPIVSSWLQDVNNFVYRGVGQGKPYFEARRSVAQAVTANTVTQVLYDVVDFDSNGWYSIPNHSYTPLQAGLYYVTAGVHVVTTTPLVGVGTVSITRSGASIAAAYWNSNTTGANSGAVVSRLVLMNGFNDFFTVAVQLPGTTPAIQADGTTFFQAFFVGTQP